MSMDTFADLFATYWPHLVGVLGTGVLGTGGLLGVFAFRRRPRAQRGPPGAYFTHKKLLAPPMTRPAYSDRMAYVLAEMSALAYFEFEGRTSMIDDAVEEALSRNLSMDANVREFLEDFSTEMMSGQRVSLTILEQCCPTNFSAVRVESVRLWDQAVRSGVRTGPGAVFARTG